MIKHTPRLLLIEDDINMAATASDNLTDLGYVVHTAHHPMAVQSWLDKAYDTQTDYDAFIVDDYLKLPHITVEGSETYGTLRLLAPPTIPIIACSSDITMWERLKRTMSEDYMHTVAKTKNGYDIPTIVAILAGLGISPGQASV